MKVSLRSVKTLLQSTLPPVDELVAKINSQLGGVEDIIDLGVRYSGARVVRVMSCDKHPNADRLSICLVDDSGVVAGVPRDENGLVQVVCGAPNVRADMWAVWLPPRTTVPASFDDAEPFVLEARKLRGVLSQGMLAAGDELALSDDHQGIIELTEYDLPDGAHLQPGAGFAQLFGLDDTVIDIENKMFTHRPDCFGQLGVAREIAGILGKQFVGPHWYKVNRQIAGGAGLELIVNNDIPQLAPRFMAVALRDVMVKPSPLWLQCKLIALGGKPINNVVDATNYVMFMTGQPTHAYDYDTLAGHQLMVRTAQAGETVELLNGKTYTLAADDVVIADGDGVIGLAGIMGGRQTEVSDQTVRVVLECANFDMYALRKTAMRHGIFTDALSRFNKGQSALQTAPVLGWLMTLIAGQPASPIYDVAGYDQAMRENGQQRAGATQLDTDFINSRLGSSLSVSEIKTILTHVEFLVEAEADKIAIYTPFWRTDIDEPEDIVEEVGRLYGFDALPRHLPHRLAAPTPKNSRCEIKQYIRHSLARAGAHEVLTYSFVHERILARAEQDISQAFKLSNALSPDLQYYRLTVLPSLLDKVHANIKAGYDEFALFEMGKGHMRMYGSDTDGLPLEVNLTDIVYARKKPAEGAPFYRVRRMIAQLGHDLGLEFVFTPIKSQLDTPDISPFDQTRSALIATTQGERVGVVGELKQNVLKNFKLPDYTAAATLDTAKLEQAYADRHNSYRPLSRFPSTWRDISLRVAQDMPYAELVNVVRQAISQQTDMVIQLQPVSIYQSAENPATKNVTLRFTFTNQAKTLTDRDIVPILQHIQLQTKDSCGAELI